MKYELVYDATTSSTAPLTALIFTAVLLGIAVAWSMFLRMRGKPLHAGAKFFFVAAVIIGIVAALTFYEQHLIGRRTDVKVVEGPLTGVWQKAERTKNASGKWRTTSWEGFWIDGVAFVYATDIDQNYFHNGGKTAMPLKDGMPLRVSYVVNHDGDRESHDITRVERPVP